MAEKLSYARIWSLLFVCLVLGSTAQNHLPPKMSGAVIAKGSVGPWNSTATCLGGSRKFDLQL